MSPRLCKSLLKCVLRSVASFGSVYCTLKTGYCVGNNGVSSSYKHFVNISKQSAICTRRLMSKRSHLEMDKIDEYVKAQKVFIFSKSYCPFCNKVKTLFESLNAHYEALELDQMGEEGVDIQKVLAEKTGQKTVPSVFISGKHIGGCDSTYKAYEDGVLQKLLDGTFLKYDYDLIVIGGGSGGLAASKEAATLGKKVAVCDFVVPSPQATSWGLGGTCVNVGCIPKKLMHKAAIIGEDMKDAPYFGWQIPAESVKHNWENMVSEIQRYIKSLNFGYRKLLMEKSVTYLNAYAQFIDQHTIKITDKKKNTKQITASDFIIAVGGRPTYPDVPGALQYCITSDDLFSLKYHPGKTLIVGASYVALECAGFLNGIGVDCTVMVRSILLRGFDQDMAERVGNHMSEHGVKFIRPCIPIEIECIKEGSPGRLKVIGQMSDGQKVENEYNTVLFAVGRKACTEGIGLEAVGVNVNSKNSKVLVNQQEQTSVPNIYAIGDVIDGRLELTPVAIQAGKLLAQRLYGNKTTLTNYENVPTTVFTPLEYGFVGMSEEDAIMKYCENDIEVYHSFFQPLEYALSERDLNKCYGKLVCAKSLDERVVGFHVLGPNAGEITQGYALGIKLGAKKSDFSSLIGIHPTTAESDTLMPCWEADRGNRTDAEGNSLQNMWKHSLPWTLLKHLESVLIKHLAEVKVCCGVKAFGFLISSNSSA